MTFDTAYEMAAGSRTAAVRPLEIPEDSVSSVMVKLGPGADAGKVAASIEELLPKVVAVLSPNMFSSYREQITGLLRGCSSSSQ